MLISIVPQQPDRTLFILSRRFARKNPCKKTKRLAQQYVTMYISEPIVSYTCWVRKPNTTAFLLGSWKEYPQTIRQYDQTYNAIKMPYETHATLLCSLFDQSQQAFPLVQRDDVSR